MVENTLIAWATHTFNPWIGCTKVGPGCDHCYAEYRDIRFAKGVHWGVGAPRQRTHPRTSWGSPIRWNREAAKMGIHPRVMCGSLCDVFDNEVSDEWRRDLWDLIASTPHLRWMLITKRIGLAPRMLPADHASWKHVGIIATMVNQEEIDRDGPKLAEVNLRWRGISVEPQLEDVSLVGLAGNVDWVITGGESQQGSPEPRPYNLAWARSIVEQSRSLGIAPFVKQLGARPVVSTSGRDVRVWLEDRKGGANPAEWPADIRVQEYPASLQ